MARVMCTGHCAAFLQASAAQGLKACRPPGAQGWGRGPPRAYLGKRPRGAGRRAAARLAPAQAATGRASSWRRACTVIQPCMRGPAPQARNRPAQPRRPGTWGRVGCCAGGRRLLGGRYFRECWGGGGSLAALWAARSAPRSGSSVLSRRLRWIYPGVSILD